jgi:hypothetical protein
VLEESVQNLGVGEQRKLSAETTMRWKIMLQCENDAGETTSVEIMKMERNSRPEFSQLGMVHRDGKQILLNAQRAMLYSQAREFFRISRPCPQCGVDRNRQRERPKPWATPRLP